MLSPVPVYRARSTGFSLIELMIAVIIIGIVLSMSISSYRTWIQNTKIRATAESIQNGLQLARSEAIKRNTMVQFNFRERAAWTVCVRPVIPGPCPNPDDATTIQSRMEKEGGSEDIVVTPTPSGTRVTFSNFGRVDNSSTGPDPFTSLDIDNTLLTGSDKRNLRILLSSGGNTRMCDPKFSYPSDPKGCP